MAAVAALGLLSCDRIATPDPDNGLPFGFVDAPRDGETVGRMVVVSGWALDDSRIAAVRLYVNGRYKASAALTVPRPDVSSAYPNYPVRDDLHGWQVEIDLGEDPGPHAILVRAVDDAQATRDIGELKVTIISR